MVEIYVVQAGDTVDGIAERFGASVEEIIYWNQLIFPYPLAIGQALVIPVSLESMPQREVISGGYAYPYIQESVLQETLPFLSQLYIFSYGFTPDGDLVPPERDEQWMIEQASWNGCEAILTLTPLGTDGRFNNNLISEVVHSSEAKENLYRNLLEVLGERGYHGVDVDFEYIKAEDRDAFTAFVAELTERMNQEGYQVSVALAPKISFNQPGLLYEGKDYAGLGAAANRVLLMTYEWGYSRSVPMAVAPINKVRQVVEYAVTEIPTDKINLGIPNYGYDWPLPYVQGETVARSIGNIEAVRIAVRHGAEILFDETAQTPHFTYENEGVGHEVWFEDARSIRAKFDLMDEFGIRGTGYWQLMRLFRANWLLMEDRFEIVKKQ